MPDTDFITLPATPEPTGEVPAPPTPTTPQAMLYSLIVNKYVSTSVVSIICLMGAGEFFYGDRIDRWLDVQEETAEALGERVTAIEDAHADHIAADEVFRAGLDGKLEGIAGQLQFIIDIKGQ